MAETLCDSGAVKLKAGADYSTDITAAQYTTLINQAEGFISAQSRYDWVTNYASVSNIGKEFLEEVCSNLAAIEVIKYEMGNYTSKEEAQTLIDVNYNKAVEGINLLRDDKFKNFVLTGSVS